MLRARGGGRSEPVSKEEKEEKQALAEAKKDLNMYSVRYVPFTEDMAAPAIEEDQLLQKDTKKIGKTKFLSTTHMENPQPGLLCRTGRANRMLCAVRGKKTR